MNTCSIFSSSAKKQEALDTLLEVVKYYFFQNKAIFLKNIFLPSAIIKWHNLDHILRNPSSFNIYRDMKAIRPNCFLIVLILK